MNVNRNECFEVVLWPDGVWCFPEELPEYAHKSDDYRILLVVDMPEE